MTKRTLSPVCKIAGAPLSVPLRGVDVCCSAFKNAVKCTTFSVVTAKVTSM